MSSGTFVRTKSFLLLSHVHNSGPPAHQFETGRVLAHPTGGHEETMSTEQSSGQKSVRTTRRIEGPIQERNRFDEFTGYEYYECGDCGRQAMRPTDLSDCCVAAMTE
jgi:hypothetical protein